MDVTAHKHIAVTVGRWHRVVVEPVAHQRQRGDARGNLLTGVVRRRQRCLEGGKIALQPLADRSFMAAQTVSHSTAAAFQQMGVQRLKALEHRDGYEEVPSRIADEPFDFAFVVALATPAEPVLEQVVRLQIGERPRALQLAVTEDARNRDLGVVVQDRLRHTPEERERPNVAVAEGFRRLRRIGHHQAGVAVRQVHRKEVDLALYATDDADRFAEVGLRMSRRMHQRNEHLLSPLTPAGHVILHNRDATRKAVFVPKPLENPLRRVLLLLRSRLVVPENALDHWNKWIKLRLRRRLLAHITRWHRELHHLVHGPWIDPEPAGRRTLAQALNANRMPHLQIEIHVLHPPPPADSRQKAICCRSFTPALPEDPAASMRDYCSGAYTTQRERPQSCLGTIITFGGFTLPRPANCASTKVLTSKQPTPYSNSLRLMRAIHARWRCVWSITSKPLQPAWIARNDEPSLHRFRPIALSMVIAVLFGTF